VADDMKQLAEAINERARGSRLRAVGVGRRCYLNIGSSAIGWLPIARIAH